MSPLRYLDGRQVDPLSYLCNGLIEGMDDGPRGVHEVAEPLYTSHP
jgi:hypothetical protein